MLIRRLFSTIVLLAFGLSLPAQTKLIAHKSHGGNEESFKIALAGKHHDVIGSNYGQAPMRYITVAQLDSIIFLNDTATIMVTSIYFKEVPWTADDDIVDFSDSLWAPGRDTVYNHPVFTAKHGLSKIRKALENDYYFRNPADSVKFLRLEQNQYVPVTDRKNEVLLPAAPSFPGSGTGEHGLFWIWSLLLFTAASVAWLSRGWQARNIRLK